MPFAVAAGIGIAKVVGYGLATAGLTIGSIEYGNARAKKMSDAAEQRSYAYADKQAAKQQKMYDKQMLNNRTIYGAASKGFK